MGAPHLKLLAPLAAFSAGIALAVPGGEGSHGRVDRPEREHHTAPMRAAPLAAMVPSRRPAARNARRGWRNGGLVEAAPGAVTVVTDPVGGRRPVFRLAVDEDDVHPVTPTDNPRAQILTRSVISEGDEIWLHTRFLLPRQFPRRVPGWMSLIAVYGPPFEGASPWQIAVERSRIVWRRNGRYRYDVPWSMPVRRGRWIDVLVRQRFAARGWVEMWVNGQRVEFFRGGSYNPSRLPRTWRIRMATKDGSNGGGANHAKIMQYRKAGMFETATVYFGPLKLGATRTSVGA